MGAEHQSAPPSPANQRRAFTRDGRGRCRPRRYRAAESRRHSQRSLARRRTSHPDRFAVMGKIDVEESEAPRMAAQWRDQPGMLGYVSIQAQSPRRSIAATLTGFGARHERAGVPFYVGMSQEHLHVIDAIAERHPGLRLILDHLALETSVKDECAFRDSTSSSVAPQPDIAVKVSSLAVLHRRAVSISNLHTLCPARLRRVRTAAHDVGQRSVAFAEVMANA